MSSAIVVTLPDSLPDSAKSNNLTEIRQNLRSNLPVTDPAQSPDLDEPRRFEIPIVLVFESARFRHDSVTFQKSINMPQHRVLSKSASESSYTA